MSFGDTATRSGLWIPQFAPTAQNHFFIHSFNSFQICQFPDTYSFCFSFEHLVFVYALPFFNSTFFKLVSCSISCCSKYPFICLFFESVYIARFPFSYMLCFVLPSLRGNKRPIASVYEQTISTQRYFKPISHNLTFLPQLKAVGLLNIAHGCLCRSLLDLLSINPLGKKATVLEISTPPLANFE